MSQILSVSAKDYSQTLKLHQLDEMQFAKLPISSYQLPDGTHQVISEYQDKEWILEALRFPGNTKPSKRKLIFKHIPTRFESAVKYAMKHYDISQSPSGGTLRENYKNLVPFINYLDSLQLKSVADITPLVCATYVDHCRSQISSRGKPLSPATLRSRFLAVESFYWNLRSTAWAFPHPWEESSAVHLAGLTGQSSIPKAKTEIIPDDQLKILIPYCTGLIEQVCDLVALKQAIETKRNELKARGLDISAVNKQIHKAVLDPKGFASLSEFNKRYNAIPTAAAILIMTFSGVRNHELCAIQWNDDNPDRDAYRIQDDEDDVYYWLKSHSSKTHEGYTEWLVPEIVIDAIEAQKTYVRPLREALWQEQVNLIDADPKKSQRALDIEGNKYRLFLTKNSGQQNQINSMSYNAFDRALKKLCESLGINGMASHRFRRTFAVYCAQSAYGDLRYLKQHFKHWSMDMTLLYAGNEAQDAELYDEIAIEIKSYKVARVEEFLDEDTIVTGGLANKLTSYRSKGEAIKTFESRAEMAEKISDSVHLRSTGHSWCTSDNSACGGRSVIEGTRCVDCAESIIEKERHGDYYKRIYIQQLELKEIDDIGEAGKQRIERDIQRCERVLKDFGLFEEVKRVS